MTHALTELQQQLIGTFFEEANEALAHVETGLLTLEADRARARELIDDIFRGAHSIKGGAATFGLQAVAELAHEAETLLDLIRAGARAIDADTIAVLLESVDALRGLLAMAQQQKPEDATRSLDVQRRLRALSNAVTAVAVTRTVATRATVDSPTQAATQCWQIAIDPQPHMLETGNDAVLLLKELARLGEVEVTADVSALPSLTELVPTSCYLSWRATLRGNVTRAQIDDVFAWVEGDGATVTVRELAPTLQQAAEAGDATEASLLALAGAPIARAEEAAVEHVKGERAEQKSDVAADASAASIRVSVSKVDLLMNMVGELVITQSMLGVLDDDGPIDAARLASLRDGLAQLARNTRSLQESVMSLRSMPIGVAFARLPRLVHDLSRQLGKHVELKLSGQATELDKTVLEKLGDPLLHLVRNSLDHGIESTEQRRAAGKPDSGTLSVSAFHRGSDIVVEIADDGRGLDTDKILQRARERGLVGADETPSDDVIRELIFAPGFSTAEVVSDVSGRGVGMDVVRRNITALGGKIHLSSTPGKGTRITLRLPLTLAIVDGQLVSLGHYTYVIPLLSIVESVQVDRQRVSHLLGRTPIYRLRDELIPMVELGPLFGVCAPRNDMGDRLMVIVEADGERIGLLVDDLLAQQQVVVKSLESNYGHIEGLAGATILGDGRVALILDVASIQRLAKRTSSGLALVA